MPLISTSRRSFIASSALAALGTLCFPKFLSNEQERATTNKKKDLHNPKPGNHDFLNPKLKSFLRLLNPTVPEIFTGFFASIARANHVIDKNLKQGTEGLISPEAIAASNADIYAGIVSYPTMYVLTSLSRMPFAKIQSLLKLGLSDKVSADISNMSAYHVQSLLFMYTETDIRKIIKDLILRALKENPKYNNDPRLIPKSKFVELIEKENQDGSLQGSLREGLQSQFRSYSEMPTDLKTSLEKPRRTLLDLALIFLSFPLTIKFNSSTGKILGTIPRQGGYGRKSLNKHPDDHEGRKVIYSRAGSGLPIGMLLHTLSSLGQGSLNKRFLHGKASTDLAYTNLRELAGCLLNLLICISCINPQRKLEELIRDHDPEHHWVLSLLRKYMEP